MRILAALIFFTRLPFWRIRQVPAEYFKRIVPYWSLSGWLTGGIMAGVLWLTAQFLPLTVAWVLAIASRLLVTGCLHEDGLADCFDAFGGGTTRERTLAIMKDSHIGSYGVIGLILYFLLLWMIPLELPLPILCALIISGDSWSKFSASHLINLLPYARKEEESKAKVIYDRMTMKEILIDFLGGALPVALFLPPFLWLACLFPVLTFIGLYLFIKKRLQGYTGDCCGAAFLLCELSFYLGAVIIYHNFIANIL